MTPHHWLPLAALALNVCLAAIAVFRNPRSRLNRVFAYFVSAMALWNFGVFMLRRAGDPGGAWFWEVLIHAGVIAVPAFYYHFVLIFLDGTARWRRWLALAYALSVLFTAANLVGGSLLLAGVQATSWGWAPVPGPLYGAFFLYFYAFLIAGLVHLGGAARQADGSFRRNRTKLILLGTTVTILGGVVDLLRFALVSVVPLAERVYPVGIPANMICAVMFGTAIVRYRMFDVSVLVKKAAVYGAVAAAVTSTLLALTWALEEAGLRDLTAAWIIGPLGLVFTLLLTPLGRPLEDGIERLMFSRPRGCHETLLELSKRMSAILTFDDVVETLVQGLVRGIPATHCALLLEDPDARAFVMYREATTSGEAAGVTSIDAGSRIAAWLERTDGVLVKEEVGLDRRIARYLGPAAEELEQIRAALIVPVKVEHRLRGIVLLGEKLSGDIFAGQELEVLSVLANQAGIAMQNARLYEGAERERRRLEVLYELSRRLATVNETDRILAVVVEEARRLLGADLAALRLVEGDELVLRASTDARLSGARPRLQVGRSLTGVVVASDRTVVVEDVVADARYDPAHKRAAAEAGFRGFLGVPIRATGRPPLGVLYVSTRPARRFRADEVSLLTALADQASVMLEKSRLAAERRQAEDALRQSEKLATMGQLLAGVAHELNNPLTVILGYSGLLNGRLKGGPMEGAAEQIEAAAQRCGRIVRNFLALARKHPPERRRVALNQLVSESLELLAYPLGVDGVEVTLELAEDLPALWADAHQLQQVIVNLLTNAQHAMRQSPVRRLVLGTRHDAERGRVVLRVADTGPGIPPGIRARIFEPFFTTKPIGQGTGLGLSLCHGIVDSHGGSIAIEDVAGFGAVFRVELPVEQPAPAGPEPAAEGAGAAVAGVRVLVVDDEPTVRALLEQVLALDGHRVDTAGDAAAALDRVEAARYDLVISDVRMPGLDGPCFYRELGRRYPQGRPRFIFMTGDLLGADTQRFLEQTGVPWLRKPFVADDLRRAVRLALAPAAATA